MIANGIRSFAVRYLPFQRPVIEIYRGNNAVRRFDYGEALDVQAESATCRRCAATTSGCWRRRSRLLLRGIGRASETGSLRFPELLIVPAGDVANVGCEPRGGRRRITQRDRRNSGFIGLRVHDVRFGIIAGARPVGSTAGVAEVNRAQESLGIADDRRKE